MSPRREIRLCLDVSDDVDVLDVLDVFDGLDVFVDVERTRFAVDCLFDVDVSIPPRFTDLDGSFVVDDDERGHGLETL
jgi:hypothetical protein